MKNQTALQNNTLTKLPSKSKKKILLSDSSVSSRQSNMCLLQESGYVVELVDNGETILTKLTAGNLYEAIIVDVYLPDMTALELARHLQPLDKKNKLVILTPDVISYGMAMEFYGVGVMYIVRRDSFVPHMSEILQQKIKRNA